jgi:hypothetical protein
MKILSYTKFNESEDSTRYTYMMLSRLQQDCDYFLGHGNGAEKHLWAGSVEGQISEMRKLWNELEIKPEWISKENIDEYEKKMLQVKAGE